MNAFKHGFVLSSCPGKESVIEVEHVGNLKAPSGEIVICDAQDPYITGLKSVKVTTNNTVVEVALVKWPNLNEKRIAFARLILSQEPVVTWKKFAKVSVSGGFISFRDSLKGEATEVFGNFFYRNNRKPNLNFTISRD